MLGGWLVDTNGANAERSKVSGSKVSKLAPLDSAGQRRRLCFPTTRFISVVNAVSGR